MASKTKRRSFSVETKMEIIKAVEAGKKKAEVARQYGIVSSTLATILKNRADIVSAFESSKFRPSRKRFRTSAHDDVEEAVLKWFYRMHAKNLPVSAILIKEKAKEVAKMFGHHGFTASSGWVSRFRERHGIPSRQICEKRARVDESEATKWLKETLPGILRGYEAKDIFAADETGLFYRLTPDKSLATKDEQCRGGKLSTERITVMLCANMSGTEKLKPLIIGKFKKPPCLRSVRSLPVDYRANRKAWMVSDLFISWVQDLDKDFTRQHRSVLLFIGDCTAHPRIPDLKSITLQFIPSLSCQSATSQLQPMDEGVKMNMKVHYRRQLLQHHLNSYDAGDVPQPINVKQAINMVYGAWQQVQPKCISRCFRKAGFIEQNQTPSPQPADEAAIEQPASDLSLSQEPADGLPAASQSSAGEPASPGLGDESASGEPRDLSVSEVSTDAAEASADQNQPEAGGNLLPCSQINIILEKLRQELQEDLCNGEDGEEEQFEPNGILANMWARLGQYMGLSDISFREYAAVDADVCCRETSSKQENDDEGIVGEVATELEEELPFFPPSTSEALHCLSRLRDYLYSRPDTNDEHFAAVTKLETHLHQCREANLAQRSVTYIIV